MHAHCYFCLPSEDIDHAPRASLLKSQQARPQFINFGRMESFCLSFEKFDDTTSTIEITETSSRLHAQYTLFLLAACHDLRNTYILKFQR